MKLIECSPIGPRPLSEFSFGGEVKVQPVPAETADLDWASYVFNRDNAPGIKREWWYHTPTGMWFVLDRNTLTDEIVKQVDIAEVQHEL